MLSKMKQITLIFTVLLAACGGGDEQGPHICHEKFYCDDENRIVSIEHIDININHVNANRAKLEVDQVVYVNEVPIGKVSERTAICEVAVNEFIAGVC